MVTSLVRLDFDSMLNRKKDTKARKSRFELVKITSIYKISAFGKDYAK